MIATPTEYDGDRCVVLPADYLETPQAAAELYADQVARVVNDLRVPQFEPRLTFPRLCLRLACLGLALTILLG